MLKNKTNTDARPDELINLIVARMATTSPETTEFAAMADQLTKIYAIKTANKAPEGLNLETIVSVVGNLIGIGMIVSHEHTHVLTSKALGFVMKAKS